MRTLALATLALLSGCASLDQVFYVDADFSPDEQQEILQAAAAWEVATHGEMRVDLVFAVPVDPTMGSAWGRRILVRVSDDEAQNCEVFGVQDGAIGDDWNGDKFEVLSIVPSRLGSNTLRGVVMHELGHHFMNGGGHSDVPSALMYGDPYSHAVPREPDEDRFVRGQCLARGDYVWLSQHGVDVGGMRMCL